MAKNEPLKLEAAESLIDGLKRYEAALESMIEARMSAAAYDAVCLCLEDIRRCKERLYPELALASTDFVIAHSTLMSILWNDQLMKIRSQTAVEDGSHRSACWADHRRAIDKLRESCERFIASGGAAPRWGARFPAGPA